MINHFESSQQAVEALQFRYDALREEGKTRDEALDALVVEFNLDPHRRIDSLVMECHA